MSIKSYRKLFASAIILAVAVPILLLKHRAFAQEGANNSTDKIAKNAEDMLDQGMKTFRFDTFGDEAFWGDICNVDSSSVRHGRRQSVLP